MRSTKPTMMVAASRNMSTLEIVDPKCEWTPTNSSASLWARIASRNQSRCELRMPNLDEASPVDT